MNLVWTKNEKAKDNYYSLTWKNETCFFGARPKSIDPEREGTNND